MEYRFVLIRAPNPYAAALSSVSNAPMLCRNPERLNELKCDRLPHDLIEFIQVLGA